MFWFVVLTMSVPFLLATIWVYLYVPQLRCLHNSCLVCFLGTFAVGSLILSSVLWIRYSWEACQAMGAYEISKQSLYRLHFLLSCYLIILPCCRCPMLFLHDICFLLAEYYLFRPMVECTWHQIWASAEQSPFAFRLLFDLCVVSSSDFCTYRYNYWIYKHKRRLEARFWKWSMLHKM